MGGLNEVRPLILSDTVNREICLSVADKNPIDGKPYADGRLLRCTSQGALLKREPHRGLKLFDQNYSQNWYHNIIYEYTFTVFARMFQVRVDYHGTTTGAWWCSATGQHIVNLSDGVLTFFVFGGKKVHLILEGTPGQKGTGYLVSMAAGVL